MHKIQSIETIIQRDSFNKGLYLTLPQGFELDISFPDQSSQKIPLHSKLSVGGSEESELCIEDYGLSPLHLSFRIHNGVLSLHNLGGKNQTLLGEQVLNHGKMYLLNLEDTIKVGDIEIKICEASLEEITSPDIPKEEQSPAVTEEQSQVDLREENSSSVVFESMTDDQIEEALDDEDEYEDVTDPEFEYDDEDDGPGFFERIKSKFKRNKKEEVKEDPRVLDIKKAAGKNIKVSPPGPFIRLFAFLSNIALSLTIANDIIPHFSLDGTFKGLFVIISPILNKLPLEIATIESIFSVLLCYIAIEALSNFILGVNFCQYIFGIRSNKGFLLSRVQAILRMIIGYFTTPVLLFDAPCIVGKRTFKEFVTGSQLSAKSKFYTIFICIFIFPVLLLSPLYAPIALNIDSFERINISEVSNVKIKKGNKIQRSWPSHSLGLKYFGKWDKNFQILPGSANNEITIYNTTNIKPVTISKQRQQKLKIQLGSMILKNPIFKIQYRDLYNFYISKSLKPLSKGAIKDYSTLVKHALSLNFEELPVIMTTHGPFLKDLFVLRSDIEKKLNYKQGVTISSHITNKKIVLLSTQIIKENKVTSIVVVDSQAEIKSYKTQAKKKESKYQNKITNLFFRNVSSTKDGSTANAWDWVKIDNLNKMIKDKNRDITDLEIASIYEYYFSLASTQMKLSKKDPTKKANLIWFSKRIKESSIHMKRLSNSGKLANVEELSVSLKNLASAVAQKDLDFFSLK